MGSVTSPYPGWNNNLMSTEKNRVIN
jgi:hypothetical protein